MSKKNKHKLLGYERITVDFYCTKCEPIEFFTIEHSDYYKTKKLKVLYCPFCGKKSKISIVKC